MDLPGGFWWYQDQRAYTGKEYIVQIRGYDPFNMLSGDYVRFAIDEAAVLPAHAVRTGSFDFFVPREYAKILEEELRLNHVQAKVRVAKDGKIIVNDLLINGEPSRFTTLGIHSPVKLFLCRSKSLAEIFFPVILPFLLCFQGGKNGNRRHAASFKRSLRIQQKNLVFDLFIRFLLGLWALGQVLWPSYSVVIVLALAGFFACEIFSVLRACVGIWFRNAWPSQIAHVEGEEFPLVRPRLLFCAAKLGEGLALIFGFLVFFSARMIVHFLSSLGYFGLYLFRRFSKPEDWSGVRVADPLYAAFSQVSLGSFALVVGALWWVLKYMHPAPPALETTALLLALAIFAWVAAITFAYFQFKDPGPGPFETKGVGVPNHQARELTAAPFVAPAPSLEGISPHEADQPQGVFARAFYFLMG